MVRFFYSNKQPAQKHKPLLNTDILIVMYYFPFEQHVKKFKELERKKNKISFSHYSIKTLWFCKFGFYQMRTLIS